MGARLTDSPIYAHLWGSPQVRAVFDEPARLQSWLEILAALAEAQAELGIVPAPAAAAIRAHADAGRLDLDLVAEQTRATGHSMLGLIRGLQQLLPDEAAEWVYYGATVQDVTDTWNGLVMARVGGLLWAGLRDLEAGLLDLAEAHRDTPAPGRTHGQQGAPVTFGFKVASWADEVRRHLDRLREGGPRWAVGQLGGGVGTLAFFGDDGVALRRAFCERLGLRDPGFPWLAARDRLAEFAHLAAMVAATLARVGGEVYALARPEIAELAEASPPGTVGSITMPHKRNPETAEHLVTLSRLARANATVLLESMVSEHERDGRAWKAEWPAFAETCLLAGTSVHVACDLIAGVEVDPAAMRRNLEASAGYAASEQVLARLAPALGKHRAQTLLQELLAEARRSGRGLLDALSAEAQVTAVVSERELAELTATPATGMAGAMVDEVVASARAARAREPATWPR